jgi:toxin ParE1/3/4
VNSVIFKRPLAKRDLVEHALFFARISGPLSDRFLASVQLTLENLATMPLLGGEAQFQSDQLVGIRTWPVKGFGKYVIYYRPLSDGIDILRILHGSRNAEALLTSVSNR